MRHDVLRLRGRRAQEMNIAVDLHMHSCLSPCGDELMTPNNIVNMALIKGLDIIAVCDHNTARHLPAIARVAEEAGLPLLPGMEITTAEEVHLLAYFSSVDKALEFSDYIYPHLPPIPNRPEFFGEQTLLDSEDEPVETEPRLLLTALDLTIGKLTRDINAAGGLEVSNAVPAPDCDTGAYKLLYSSDAHCLENIAEREYFLNVPECSSKGLFEYLCACRERVWSANFC